MKISFSFLLICCCFLTINNAYSQIGVNTETPHKLTELQVLNIVQGTDTIPKGIMIPRLNELQRDAMDVSVATEVNSLMIYNITEDCYNYYSRLNKEWQSLCGKIGKADFTLDCSSIQVGGKGTYATKVPLDGSHYLKVKVNVTKIGSYNITAMPDPENGYYFTLTGEFLSLGEFTLIIPGAGVPQTPTTDQDDFSKGDLIKFKLNGIDSDCTTIIHIIDSTVKPAFTMNCGSTRAYGIYKIGVELDATNFITVTINGDISGGTGAKAVIKTNAVDGMQFISNPVDIIGGLQVITLYGTGSSGSAGTKTFVISSNSTTSTSTCSVSLNTVMKPKRLLSIGTPSTYGYNFSQTCPSAFKGGTYDFTHDARNFGVSNTSIVQIENLDIIGMGPSITTSQLASYTSGANKVDMIVIAYNTGWSAANNAAIGKLLGDYVKNGNPLFLMGDNNTAGVASSTAWTSIMSNVFEGTTSSVVVEDLKSTSGTVGPGVVLRLSSYNHPVLNGLFGDARGQYWGEDASVAQVALNLPMDEVVLLTGSTDVSTPGFQPATAHADGATAFVHRKYPFVFIGDGGFNSHANNNTSSTICPFVLDAVNFPIPKNNYGRGSAKQPVWNSIIFGNVIAWGLRIVEGIEIQ